MDDFINVWTVAYVDVGEPAAVFVFVFLDETEAERFADHLRTYYQRPMTVVVATSTDNYDTAMVALVEAVGPSDDS